MAKAFLDTTILTDYLLKEGLPKDNAKAALAVFSEVELPMYAIKEFKGGPLKNFVWMYNKFVSTKSFTASLEALHRMSRTPKRYTTSTALEALVASNSNIAAKTPGELVKRYGADADLDVIQCAEMRLALKRIIFQSWANKEKIATKVVFKLTCYDEKAPYENREMLELKPTRCEKEKCCLEPELRSREDDLRKMRQAILDSDSSRPEDTKRAQALREVYRKSTPVTEATCRALGDAIFVALAPSDAVILTTNVRDHKLLADSIGKTIQSS